MTRAEIARSTEHTGILARGLAHLRALGDFDGAAAIGGQGLTVGLSQSDFAGLAHPPDAHARVSRGIPNQMQGSEYVH